MTPRERAGPSSFAASPRFLAALVLSILLHFALPLVLSGGVPRSHNASPLTRALTVRVVPQPQQPTADPSPPRVPVSEELRETASPRPVPAVREAVVPRAPSPAAPSQSARPAGAVPEAPDLTYYAAKQLDVYPALSAPLDLKYRGKAADDGVAGRALLLVLIDEVGTVRDVSIVEAEPANTFEDDAKRALTSARFSPAYRNGRTVRSRVLIEVNYGVERGSP
jgi:protein TonB